MPDLVVLHTNDLHGKLSDAAAERIAEEKAKGALLLDAGDAISSGNVYYKPWGEPVLARMSDLGYDAMAMGNREFHFLSAGLRSKVKLARFPILSANLHGAGPTVSSHTYFDIGGLQVALFGLSVRMIRKPTFASPYWFSDPLEAAAELVPNLSADLVIAVTHIGLAADRELAASVPGIDLVVGGHTHAVLREPERVGETAIVQAGWWGHYLGRVEITLKPRSIRGELIPLRR
ncbi:MAG: bifunctional metallophosphatase/5'-nucleotidase [Armatimonadota bacterium]